MTYKQNIGKLGERLAANFLKRRGYKILAVNFNCASLGEIDIIAQKDQIIHFCEVKTRTSLVFGYPEEAVNQSKLNRLSKAATIYLNSNKLTNFDRQIDVLSVILNFKTRRARLEHLQNFS